MFYMQYLSSKWASSKIHHSADRPMESNLSPEQSIDLLVVVTTVPTVSLTFSQAEIDIRSPTCQTFSFLLLIFLQVFARDVNGRNHLTNHMSLVLASSVWSVSTIESTIPMVVLRMMSWLVRAQLCERTSSVETFR